MPRDLSDETKIREEDKRSKGERRQELADLRAVLGMPEGRRFLWRYLRACDRISAADNGSWTYFYEGERNVSLQIKAEAIEADERLFLLMQAEAIEKQKKEVRNDS
jgi:hypothetical protein